MTRLEQRRALTGPVRQSRAVVAVAAAVWALAVGCVITSLVLLVVPEGPMPPHGFGSPAGDAIVALAYAATASVGALIATRRPRSPLGWIMLAAGFLTASASMVSEYYTLALLRDLPGAAVTAWYGAWAWELGAGLAVSFALLLFPTGRLPSRRWRPAAWFGAFCLTVLTLGQMLAPGPLAGEFRLVANPAGIDGASWLEALRDAAWGLLFVLTAISASALVRRWRRAGHTERAQLKWFGFAAALAAPALVLRNPALFGGAVPLWVEALLVLAVLSFPTAFGVAVLHYRLFDIDRVVSRTVGYALLTALLGSVYMTAALLLGRVLTPFEPGNDLAVAAATLLAAALFRPARARIQALVDRRFNRARYDGARTLEAFRATIRDQRQLDAIVAALTASVRGTLQPSAASVWLPTDEPGAAARRAAERRKTGSRGGSDAPSPSS